ncbi:hypothetical protein AB0O57_17320 [Streptomyces sp. NPDC091201]|uniref:hypothetical protein n=1 Tax=Streptomyces sp. NPDC091201 TaxID=3155190 RepID=UPI003414AE14
MTSFATHRLRVHDTARPAHRRLSALRTCLTQFAPYGFRATYDHLCRSAGVPARLEEDPGALVWAVEELHAAREIWRAEQAAWEARRRVQKGEGRRTPDPPQPTRLLSCPDPEFHPAGPLPALMPRIMRARTDRPAVSCPLCEADHGTVERHDPEVLGLGAVRVALAAPAVTAGRAVLGVLGGEPDWLQYDETPGCPGCARPMEFAAGLEEGPDPVTSMNFGSGRGYAHVCRGCGRAAFLWQC